MNMSTALGIKDDNTVSITPYPNPTANYINIPFNNITENASLEIYSVSGKLISKQDVNCSLGDLKVDVSKIANGTYLFNLNFEDGRTSKFNVVISK